MILVKKMGARKKQRAFFLLFAVVMLSFSIFLALSALRDNVVFFFSPSEVQQGKVKYGHVFRLGGLVITGSLQHLSLQEVTFLIGDGATEIPVLYQGILPDLFAEGQGAVARGQLDKDGLFRADEILAKHDENYAPPELQKILDGVNP